MSDAQTYIATVRRALGRREPVAVPPPPGLDAKLIRTISPEENLPQRFVAQAQASGMTVTRVELDQLVDRLIALLREAGATTVALPVSMLFDSLDLAGRLNEAGIKARRWDESTADAVFDVDCGITDVDLAIAETGSLVIRAKPGHGRVLSLAPAIHVAVVQPRQIVPDLLDALGQLEMDGCGSGTVVITGPSKTTDIEGNLVIGVHGPGTVHVLLLE